MTGVLPQENIEKRRAFKKQPEIVRFFFEYHGMGWTVWGGKCGPDGMGRKVWPGKYGPESMARKVWGGKYGQEDRNAYARIMK